MRRHTAGGDDFLLVEPRVTVGVQAGTLRFRLRAAQGGLSRGEFLRPRACKHFIQTRLRLLARRPRLRNFLRPRARQEFIERCLPGLEVRAVQRRFLGEFGAVEPRHGLPSLDHLPLVH